MDRAHERPLRASAGSYMVCTGMAEETPGSKFAAWLDRFFAAYYAGRPVNATFMGVHAHDHRLPDLSENGAGDLLAGMKGLLREAEGFLPGTLAAPERLDLKLACGFLRTQIWEMGSRHFHRGNPSFYTGEAVFGLVSLLLTDFAPAGDRRAAVLERMEAIPAFLEQARAQVREAPGVWTERAVDECRGAGVLLGEGLARWCASQGLGDEPLAAEAAARAAAAFAEHAAQLERSLRVTPSDALGCGEQGLAVYLEQGHFLEEGAEELARHAEAQQAEARARVEAGARGLGFASPAAALEALAQVHPSVDDYPASYDSWSAAVRERAETLALLTWPERPLRFVPLPEWARAAAPHLYFLPYRAPAAFDAPPVHDCLVPFLDPNLPVAEQAAFLRAHNTSVIKLNYVIHHAGLGHHVQNARAAEAPSRIGRVAAIDCASRIAMFCGGTMAEGWACYATDLAAEAGLLTPLEALGEDHTRVRMCARAVVDVRLQQGRFRLDEAVAYYERQAGLPHAAARREAIKNSMFPGAAVMYVLGTDALHRLRREEQVRSKDAFDLREFHDAVLSHGSVPVSLVAQAFREAHEVGS